MQARLVKILAQSDLELSLDELQQRFDSLLALLPDLGASLVSVDCKCAPLLAAPMRMFHEFSLT
jgi:hypothetical protein